MSMKYKYYEPFVKVVLSSKEEHFIPLSKWEQILQSPSPLVAYRDADGENRGRSINKSFVVSSEPADEKTNRRMMLDKVELLKLSDSEQKELAIEYKQLPKAD